MENTLNPFNTIIRCSYTLNSDDPKCDFLNNCYVRDLKELIDTYNQEKNHYKLQIYKLELENYKLLQPIYFLDMKCRFINITHNNTINFIMTNYSQIKSILDRLLNIYNKNIDDINFCKEKIYNIISTINALKSNINYYENNK